MTTRSYFDEELKKVHENILLMSAMVEEMLENSIKALKEHNIELGQKVIHDDDAIDRKEIEIQDFCIKLLAKQHPLAKDLRLVTAALKIIGDLERIADNAVDIAKIVIRISNEKYMKHLIDIPRMADLTILILKDAIDSYIEENISFANEVSLRDNQIDALFKQIYLELLDYMMEDPKKFAQATHFIFIARYLERVADHATNICEAVIYLVTGEYKDLND